VGVPIKASFKELVAGGRDPNNVTGYCIDIFNAAINLLPYPVPCQFVTIGDGTKNPNYDDIINMVAANVCSHSLFRCFNHFVASPLIYFISFSPLMQLLATLLL
jgi:hypothetical protein